MRTIINISNKTKIIYNQNLENYNKYIYTPKHINNAHNNSLIKNKHTNNTSKTKTKISKKNKK